MKKLAGGYGLDLANCNCYGDSVSDIPLFKTLKNSVSIKASASVEELAAANYRGRDLWQAYVLERALAARPPELSVQGGRL